VVVVVVVAVVVKLVEKRYACELRAPRVSTWSHGVYRSGSARHVDVLDFRVAKKCAGDRGAWEREDAVWRSGARPRRSNYSPSPHRR